MLRFLAVFIFFISPALAAQPNVFDYPAHNENINKIQEIIPQPTFLRGNFEQIKSITGSEKKFISSGNFIFSKEAGLYWNSKKPFSSITVFTKNGLLKIEDGEKKIISADSSPFFREFSQIFQSVFSGETKKIRHNFDIFFTGTPGSWVLGFRSNNDTIKNIITEIVIRGGKNTEEIILKEKSGDSTIIKLKNVASPKSLTKDEENYFQF